MFSQASEKEILKIVVSYWYTQEYLASNYKLRNAYQLPDASIEFFMNQVSRLIRRGGGTVQMVLEDIRNHFHENPVPDEKMAAFLRDVIRTELWPLREIFGLSFQEYLNEKNIPVASLPAFRVHFKPITYSGASTEIAEQVGFSLLDPRSRERLRDLVLSRQKGTRTKDQVVEILLRPMDFGGLGMDQAMATRTSEVMETMLKTASVISEQEYANWIAERMTDRPAVSLEAEVRAESAPKDEIEEAKDRIQNLPKPPVGALENAIDAIVTSVGYTASDEYLARRLRSIISSRLRDIRSKIEISQVLQRDVKVGGMGLAQAEADPIAEKIEVGYASYHDPIRMEEKNEAQIQEEIQKQKITERRKEEAEEHAHWFQEKLAERKALEEEQRRMAVEMKKLMSETGSKPSIEEVKGRMKEVDRFGELVPAVANGAARIAGPVPPAPSPKPGPIQPPAPKPPTIRPVPLTPTSPTSSTVPSAPSVTIHAARPEVKVSIATTELHQQAMQSKPSMDGVRSTQPVPPPTQPPPPPLAKKKEAASGISPRLMGPVQELAMMNISEFRRLARTPQGAAQAIIQKVAVLTHDGIERRIQGIRAWQSSPLQKDYLSLVSQAFREGKPVSALAQEKHRMSSDALSNDEIAAIISLNSALHL